MQVENCTDSRTNKLKKSSHCKLSIAGDKRSDRRASAVSDTLVPIEL